MNSQGRKTALLCIIIMILALWSCSDDKDSATNDESNNDSSSTDNLENGQNNLNGDNNAGADDETEIDNDSATENSVDCPGNIAWYRDNSAGLSKEVGQLEPNAFGLYDMLGNTIEWTSDCYHFNYENAPTDGSSWMDEGDECDFYVIRGGCFGGPESMLRVSRREAATPTEYGLCATGVRCARDLDASEDEDTRELLTHLEWVEIPAGTFEMGCTEQDLSACFENEFPVRTVTLLGFYLTKTEVTALDYFNITGKTPNVEGSCPTCAANHMTLWDAQDFCSAIGGRLPTEAEWEYAARAQTTTAYYCQ